MPNLICSRSPFGLAFLLLEREIRVANLLRKSRNGTKLQASLTQECKRTALFMLHGPGKFSEGKKQDTKLYILLGAFLEWLRAAECECMSILLKMALSVLTYGSMSCC